MPVYEPTESGLNLQIEQLSPEDRAELKKRVNELMALNQLAEEIWIFFLRYGRYPSALNNS